MTWQMIGRCPVPISLTADAHSSAPLGAFFYWTRCFENNVPFDNTTPIYLINLLWKLGVEFGSDSELHYFSIFHEELRKVSTLSSRNFTDGNILITECNHIIQITYSRSAHA